MVKELRISSTICNECGVCYLYEQEHRKLFHPLIELHSTDTSTKRQNELYDCCVICHCNHITGKHKCFCDCQITDTKCNGFLEGCHLLPVIDGKEIVENTPKYWKCETHDQILELFLLDGAEQN